MENTITFTYNPYFYFQSFNNVLENLRKYYPTEEVYIYFDGDRTDLEKYVKVANDYKCNIQITQNNMGYLKRTDSLEVNHPKMKEWIRRLIETCSRSKSKWIMLLEDDVLIKRKILQWPNSHCGLNRDGIGFLGGGSIFQREKFLQAISNIDIDRFIKHRNNHWAGDLLLGFIFLESDATYEKWVELAEPGYYDSEDHAVFHGYKDLHNLEL